MNLDMQKFFNQIQMNEWDHFYLLTNKRKLKSNDAESHKEVVMNGYNKIMNLLSKSYRRVK